MGAGSDVNGREGFKGYRGFRGKADGPTAIVICRGAHDHGMGLFSTPVRQGRMLMKSLLSINFHLILLTYLIVYVVFSLVIWFYDPDVKNLSDALWFTFETATTIGYGDIIVDSVVGRTLTVILSIYSIAVVAIFTGVIAGFFVEIMKLRAHESATEFLDELERLPELSHEELVSLSEKAKRFRMRRGESTKA